MHAAARGHEEAAAALLEGGADVRATAPDGAPVAELAATRAPGGEAAMNGTAVEAAARRALTRTPSVQWTQSDVATWLCLSAGGSRWALPTYQSPTSVAKSEPTANVPLSTTTKDLLNRWEKRFVA
eukprot:1177145-Prorocentrum_minimum.AAC.4